MAHEILGENFWSYRKPGWHNLGTVSEETLTALQAGEKVDILYDVLKLPIQVDTPWGPLTSGNSQQYALVREPIKSDPEPRIFSTVGRDYEVIQNRQILEAVEPLSQHFPVETIGVLGLGERIFLTLDLGRAEVGGDELREFVLVSEDKTGNGGLNVGITRVRVVCANTLAMALGGGVVKLTHQGGLAEAFRHELDVVRTVRAARDTQLVTLEQLARTQIDLKQAEAVFSAAYPNRNRPRANRFKDTPPDNIAKDVFLAEAKRTKASQDRWLQECERQQEFREAAKSLYFRFNDEFPRTAGTAWAALNAVTELSDHRPAGTRPNAETEKAISVVFGTRAQEKAAALAQCLTYI